MKYYQLSKEAKELAKASLINDIIQWTEYEDLKTNSKLKKAFDKAEEMKTPWFLGEYILIYCDKQLNKELRRKHYNYREDGSLIIV